MKGKAAEQRKTGRRWIARPGMNHRGAHEIAQAIKPGPALTALPSSLPVSDQPIALSDEFTSPKLRSQVGVGRSGFWNSPDQAAAKSTLAAIAASAPRPLVSSQPSGEMNSADTASNHSWTMSLRPVALPTGSSKYITLTILR